MNPFDRSYMAHEVATLAGTTTKNVQNWTQRGLIGGHSDTTDKRKQGQYSWFNVMEVACAVALMEIGLNRPQIAFTAAMHFAHIGKGQTGWVGEPAADQAVRYPGLPFHHMRGVTFLYVAGENSAVMLHRIFNEEPFAESYFTLRRRLGAEGWIALNVTEVLKAVMERAGEDYRKMLDAAYAGQDVATTWKQPGEGKG